MIDEGLKLFPFNMVFHDLSPVYHANLDMIPSLFKAPFPQTYAIQLVIRNLVSKILQSLPKLSFPMLSFGGMSTSVSSKGTDFCRMEDTRKR